MIAHIRPAARPLTGEIRVPGDKSISHRAVLFAAMAEGTSRLAGVLDSEDVHSTIAAVEALGARVVLEPAEDGGLEGTVAGWGSAGPREPETTLDCGNSGTTARLLSGVLAGWPITATLVGDESLASRPMARIAGPLSEMGAGFVTTEGRLPMTVTGGELTPVEYDSPVASAQVKSAVLLAGLRASGRTLVREPAQSRDHTERMLPLFGVAVGTDPEANAAWVDGPATPGAADVAVPGDPSSAAFIVVAALLVPGSELRVIDVALNPTRTGFLRVLARMGADIEVEVAKDASEAELRGDIVVRHTPELRAVTVEPDEVPSLIDEVPILALAAARAEGRSMFKGVGELRVKESDRLGAIIDGLGALGVDATTDGESLAVGAALGGTEGFSGADIDARGDHRLAMTWAVAGLVCDSEVRVHSFESVAVSYPGFIDDLAKLGAR